MPLKTFVKASGINNLSDARYFSVYPVNWLSYNCNSKANNYVTLETIKELHGWVEGPSLALEVESLTETELDEIIAKANPQGIQVNKNFIYDTDLFVFRKFIVDKDTNLTQIIEVLDNKLLKTDFLLLDFQTINFNSIDKFTQLSSLDLQNLNARVPVLVNNVSNVDEVQNFLTANLFGLEIAGGEEEKAGIRSFEDIQDIMDELEDWE